MHRADRKLLLTDVTIQMHQTGSVGGDDIICARLQRIIDFLIGHSRRDGLELDRKAATETTTGFHIIHLQQLQPVYPRQKLPWLLLDPAFA